MWKVNKPGEVHLMNLYRAAGQLLTDWDSAVNGNCTLTNASEKQVSTHGCVVYWLDFMLKSINSRRATENFAKSWLELVLNSLII